MIEEGEGQELLQHIVHHYLSQKQINPEQLANLLRCYICEGLYRSAHTIIDCGHTFCEICLISYMKGFKGRNPAIKCPECHILVDLTQKRAIFKDVFKQKLVDVLAPQFVNNENVILQRLNQLFPQLDVRTIFEQYKLGLNESQIKSSRKEGVLISNRLIEKVKQKFNLKFQAFCQMICNEENFNKLLVITQNSPEPTTIQIKPRTIEDYTFIGLDNKMKIVDLTLRKLQRFIEKKALQKIQTTNKVPDQWMNDGIFQIKLFMTIKGRLLEENDDIDVLLKENKNEPIFYSISK